MVPWYLLQHKEALPDHELNLDGMAPPPLLRLHKRLAKRSGLLKYRVSSAQFRRQSSELYLPEGIYRLYDNVVKDCEVGQKTKPAPPRSRFSGVRANVVFKDHCKIKHMARKQQLFLLLDGACSGEHPKKRAQSQRCRICCVSGCMFTPQANRWFICTW